MKDFEVFHPDRMASRILDMGDVLTLIEQAEKAFDRGQAEEMAAQVPRRARTSPSTTSSQQMAAIKKMGSLKSMLGMMPGMGQMRTSSTTFDEREFDRVEAMVRSMTPFERTHPKHDQRLAPRPHRQGLGRQVSEVNQLLERFGEAQKMMKRWPAAAGCRACRASRAWAARRKGKAAAAAQEVQGSGNPAKRAAEERRGGEGAVGQGLGWRLRCRAGGAGTARPADFDPRDLPKGFEKFLGR